MDGGDFTARGLRGERPSISRAQAARSGCNVESIAAYWGALGGVGGTLQAEAPLVFVPLAWAEAAPLSEMPTTLLLDRSRKVVWFRVGALGSQAYRSLEREIQSLGEEGR